MHNKYYMKNITFVIVFLALLNTLPAQRMSYFFRTALENANYTTIDDSWRDQNTWKYGPVFELGAAFAVRKWFNIESSLLYRERKALEMYTFPSGGGHPQGLTAKWIFAKYPSSPQSPNFDPTYFKHLPNFKYLHLCVTPTVSVGHKMRFTAGVGIFGGILLNRADKQVTKEDLPHVKDFFQAPFYVYGSVNYNLYDFGFAPRVQVEYSIAPKRWIGLTFSSQHSLSHLNNDFVRPGYYSNLNIFWLTFSGGVSYRMAF
jgi:hypothetical protein